MKSIAKNTFHNCQASNIFISRKIDISPKNSTIFKLRKKVDMLQTNSNIFKLRILTQSTGTDCSPYKFLIWQTICSCGVKSAPYVTRKTLRSDVYGRMLKETPFAIIKTLYVNTIFWPYLAIIHYFKKTSGMIKVTTIWRKQFLQIVLSS